MLEYIQVYQIEARESIVCICIVLKSTSLNCHEIRFIYIESLILRSIYLYA